MGKTSRSIKQKLTLLVLAMVVGFCATEYINHITTSGLRNDLQDVGHVQLPAVLNMTMVDMMHDGLRAVVLRSIVAAQTDNAEEKAAAAAEVKEMTGNMRQYIAEVDKLPLGEKIDQAITAAMPDLEAYVASAGEMVETAVTKGSDEAIEQYSAFQEKFEKLEGSLGALGELVETSARDTVTHDEEDAAKLQRLALTIFGCSLCICLAVAFWIAVSIVRPLDNVMNVMKGVASQLSLSATQIGTHGQTLAQGATEQAASLEETAASLEEISSMAGQNANNSKQANTLSVQVQEVSTSGVDSMTRMKEAIESIKASSDETAAIIKTIDEIAFQTNLLALNAAVEAARAGDAGKGFAVVADEVRSLAQRSSGAAKDTAEIIRRSRELADNGVKVSADVGRFFGEISETSVKAASIVKEIAAGSQEQSAGMSQINTAVSELDKVTQLNAASAEEFAATGDELITQSKEMEAALRQLESVIYGSNSGSSKTGVQRSSGSGVARSNRKAPTSHVSSSVSSNVRNGSSIGRLKNQHMNGNSLPPMSSKTIELSASQIIPLEESDF